jgi:hypothetical protein
MFLSLLDPDPDPSIRRIDPELAVAPDPDLNPFYHQVKKVRKTLIPTAL